ncbi:PQQ-binding-like beta-propeller repeat protein [Methanospirillum stamsii]|nr:PQQ-binding-like beta-propeller repeat protein [Methanospirillum stamsii]
MQAPELKKWTFKTGDAVEYSSPAVSNGVVFFGSWDSILYALDASTGNKIWSFKTGDSVYSSPAIFNGIVYFGSEDGNVYAVDATTGNEIWKFKTGDGVKSSPAIFNGIVYFGSEDGNVYAVDATTGIEIWKFKTGDSVYSTPAVFNGVVFVVSRCDNLYALDASTGSKIWMFKPSEDILYSVAVSNGVVYLGTSNFWSGQHNYVYALDASTGNKIWAFQAIEGGFESDPVISNGILYVGSISGIVYALDADTGNKKWEFQPGGQICSSDPAISNGVLYVGSTDGYLYAIGRPASQNPNSQLTPSTSDTIQTSTAPVNLLPDLTITKISMKQMKDVIAGTLTIENKGTGDAGKFTITYFLTDTLKNDLIFGNNGIYVLGEDSANGLAAGDQRDSKDTKMFTIPGNVPPGSYAVGVFIDSKNVVEESDEENNVVYDINWVQVS